jgi:hypothetical protein
MGKVASEPAATDAVGFTTVSFAVVMSAANAEPVNIKTPISNNVKSIFFIFPLLIYLKHKC